MGFASWLRQARTDRDLSQDALAAKARALDAACHVQQTRVSEWERGESIPSWRQFVAVCRALDLDAGATGDGRQLWEREQVPPSTTSSPLEA